MSISDNFTIVIPTYKRYPFLKRLLKFYDDFAIPINILILDSTPYEPSDKEIKQLLSTEGKIWKKFDPETTYWDKIAKGTEFIETKYVTLCADDDFIMPGAIAECIKFLKSNKDYSSAHGLYFSHQSAEQSKKTGFTLAPLYHKGRSETQDLSRDRVRAYLSGKTAYYPLYAVQKTETFKLIWSETDQYVSDWNLHELFSSCLSFVYGKMKILPVFYSSREPNTYAINNYEMFKRTFSEDKVKKAVEGVAKHLKKVDSISIEEAEKVARIAFENYLKRSKTKIEKLNSTPNNNILPLWRKVKQKLRIRTRFHQWFYKGCHPSIYPKYFNDFIRVRDLVISEKLSEEELNVSRKDFAEQGDHITN